MAYSSNKSIQAATLFGRALDTATWEPEVLIVFLHDIPIILRRRFVDLMFGLLDFWASQYDEGLFLNNPEQEAFLADMKRYSTALNRVRVE